MTPNKSTGHHTILLAILAFVVFTIGMCAAATEFTLSSVPISIDSKFAPLSLAGVIPCSSKDGYNACKPASDQNDFEFYIQLSLKNDCKYAESVETLTTQLQIFDDETGINILNKPIQLERMINNTNINNDTSVFFQGFVNLALSTTPSNNANARWSATILTMPKNDVLTCENEQQLPSFDVSVSVIYPIDEDAAIDIWSGSIKAYSIEAISLLAPKNKKDQSVLNLGSTSYLSKFSNVGSLVIHVPDINRQEFQNTTFSDAYTIALVPTGILQSIENLDILFPQFQCAYTNGQYTTGVLTAQKFQDTNTSYWSIPYNPKQNVTNDALVLTCTFQLNNLIENDIKNLVRSSTDKGFMVLFPKTTQECIEDWTLDISTCSYASRSGPYQYELLFSTLPTTIEQYNDQYWVTLPVPNEPISATASRLVPLPTPKEDFITSSTFEYVYTYSDSILNTENKSLPTKLSQVFFGIEFIANDAQSIDTAKYDIICVDAIKQAEDDIKKYILLTGYLESLNTTTTTTINNSILSPEFNNLKSLIVKDGSEVYNETPFGEQDPTTVTCTTYQLHISLIFYNKAINNNDDNKQEQQEQEEELLTNPQLIIFIGNEQYKTRSVKDYKTVIYSVYNLQPLLVPPTPEPEPEPTPPVNPIVDVLSTLQDNGVVLINMIVNSTEEQVDATTGLTIRFVPVTDAEDEPEVQPYRFYDQSRSIQDETTFIVKVCNEEMIATFQSEQITIPTIPSGIDNCQIQLPKEIFVIYKLDEMSSTSFPPRVAVSISDWGIESNLFILKKPTIDKDPNVDPEPQPDDDELIVRIENNFNQIHGFSSFIMNLNTENIQTKNATQLILDFNVGTTPKNYKLVNHGENAIDFKQTTAIFKYSNDITKTVIGIWNNEFSTLVFTSDETDEMPLIIGKQNIIQVTFPKLHILLSSPLSDITLSPKVKVNVNTYNYIEEFNLSTPITDQDYVDGKFITVDSSLNKHGATLISFKLNSEGIVQQGTSLNINLTPQNLYKLWNHGDKKAIQNTKALINGTPFTAQCTDITCNLNNISLPLGKKSFEITFPSLIILTTTTNGPHQASPEISIEIKDWDILETYQVAQPYANKDWADKNDNGGGLSGVAVFFIVILILAVIVGVGYFGWQYYVKNIRHQNFSPRAPRPDSSANSQPYGSLDDL